MVRLAGLLGADDPEDIAQDGVRPADEEARLPARPAAALAYLRASVAT